LSVQRPPNVLGNSDGTDRENDGKNQVSKNPSKESHAANGSMAGRLGRPPSFQIFNEYAHPLCRIRVSNFVQTGAVNGRRLPS
jgi:hypothetical protein